jgi:hypothetical protein
MDRRLTSHQSLGAKYDLFGGVRPVGKNNSTSILWNYFFPLA